MRRCGPAVRFYAHASLTLAALALALQLLIPSGFMPVAQPGAGVRIVVCTGHGPVTALLELGKKAPQRKGAADAPCAFASHGAAPTLTPTAAATAAAWTAVPTPTTTLSDQVSIGRGLAAPPPARAPPTLLA